MELCNLALVRAAAAECQMLQRQQHHQRPAPAVLPAFYPSNIVPAAGTQSHSTGSLPFAVIPNRCGPALQPTQSVALPVYASVAPASYDTALLQTVATAVKSRDNPSSDEVGGRVADSKTRPTLTGSRSTTPLKRHVNNFSIDSLLGRQDCSDGEKWLGGAPEIHKSVEDRDLVDAEVTQSGARHTALHRSTTRHRPTSPGYFASAPAPHIVPGCIARPELVTWF